MLTFRSLADSEQAHLPPKLRRAVIRAMRTLLDAYGSTFTPDDCGCVVLVTKETTDADALALFGRPWPDIRLEGVTLDRETGCFLTCVLFDNQRGHTILVPNEPWLNPAFRAALVAELGGSHEP